MKNGLIRLTNEKDIFYDSIEKIYRYRMHCPKCGALGICKCYDQDLDGLRDDIDDGIADYTCSSKCALIIGKWDKLAEAMQSVGIYKDASDLIKKVSDAQIKKYLKKEYDGCHIFIDWDKRTHEDILTMLEENNLIGDMLEYFNISRGKSIEELSEEESRKVFDLLTEDGDFDFPGGKECVIKED